MSRWARRTDASQKPVIEALRAMGCTVRAIQSAEAGCPDLVVGFAGRTHLVEVKPSKATTKDKRQLTRREAQVKFAEVWRGGVVPVVHDVDEAMALVLQWRNQQLVEHRAAQAMAKLTERRAACATVAPACTCDEATKNWRDEDRWTLCGHLPACPQSAQALAAVRP